MKHLYDKAKLNAVLESIKLTVGNTVFIHHPITEDLVTVIIKEVKKDQVLVSIPLDSPYIGQPDWYIKKINIIGVQIKPKFTI